MTLNLTILTRDRVYQSSDFRLTNSDTGKEVDSESTKAVHIQNTDFTGLLTYTGVGRCKGKDTSRWLVNWLEALGDCTLQAAKDGLVSRSTSWLRRMGNDPSTGRPYRMTIVLASFSGERAKAEVACISNFEDIFGRDSGEATRNMRISSLTAAARPELIVTGCKPLSRDSRKRLQNLARRKSTQPQSIRNALAVANAEAANSRHAKGMISESCTVLSLASDGAEAQIITPGGKAEILGVMRGQALPDMRKLASSLGLSAASPVQAAFTSLRPANRPPAPTVCAPGQVDVQDDFELVEFSLQGVSRMRAIAINAAGLVVVAGASEEAPGAQSFWEGRSASDLRHVGLANSADTAFAGLSDRGLVVGAADDRDGFLRAVACEGGYCRALNTPAGRDSAALAVASNGVIVGWVSLSGTDRGQLQWRPAIWWPGGEALTITDLPTRWGQAIAVDDEGAALLWLMEASGLSVPAMRDADGQVAIIGGAQGRGVIPRGMTGGRHVLGVFRSPRGRVGVVAQGVESWRQLGTDPDWEPTAIAEPGLVAGYVLHRGFRRPWVREPSGKIRLLPYYADHHCQPFAINTRGDVVGMATADHGEHALLWRRRCAPPFDL